MLPGCPLLNSMVNRSYPVWAPACTRSMNAEGGDWFVVSADAAQIGRGDAVGLGLSEGEGAGAGHVGTQGVGVVCPVPAGARGPRFNGLPISRTPTRMLAITAAARAAI